MKYSNAFLKIALGLSFAFLPAACTPKANPNKVVAFDKGQVLLCDVNNNDIQIFSDVKVNPERMFTPDFQNPSATSKAGIAAVVLESFNKGFEEEAIAEKIETAEGNTGWVAEQNICIPAKLTKQEEDGKNYLRTGETLSHPAVKELDAQEPIFIQKSAYSTIHNFKGCENDWYFAVTADGQAGYVLCSFVTAIQKDQ